MKSFLIYKKLSTYMFQIHLNSPLNFWPLSIGKFIRMIFMLLFLTSLFGFIDTLAGYTFEEVFLIYSVFNVIDVVSQSFYSRGLWFMQDEVRDGRFDLILTKPVHPLVMVTGKQVDWMDITTMIPTVAILGYALWRNGIGLVSGSAVWFYAAIGVGLVFLLAINIVLASVTFFTIEIEQLWFVYNELLKLGKYPPEVVGNFLRAVFTYLIPVFIIFFLPVRLLLFEMSLGAFGIYVLLTICLLLFSLKIWNYSVKQYSSASS